MQDQRNPGHPGAKVLARVVDQSAHPPTPIQPVLVVQPHGEGSLVFDDDRAPLALDAGRGLPLDLAVRHPQEDRDVMPVELVLRVFLPLLGRSRLRGVLLPMLLRGGPGPEAPHDEQRASCRKDRSEPPHCGLVHCLTSVIHGSHSPARFWSQGSSRQSRRRWLLLMQFT